MVGLFIGVGCFDERHYKRDAPAHRVPNESRPRCRQRNNQGTRSAKPECGQRRLQHPVAKCVSARVVPGGTGQVTGQTALEDGVRAYGLAKSGLIEHPFMLSLVQTAEGLSIAHELRSGDTAQAKTLLTLRKCRSCGAKYLSNPEDCAVRVNIFILLIFYIQEKRIKQSINTA